MYLMVFRLLLPYVQRYLANYAADYLENRRAAKQTLNVNNQSPTDCPPCPPPTMEATASTNTLWYSLSGVLLGGALGTILFIFWRDANSASEFEL